MWVLSTIFLGMRKDTVLGLDVLSPTLKSDWQWEHLPHVMGDLLLPLPSCIFWQMRTQNLFSLPRIFELVSKEKMWISLIFWGVGRKGGAVGWNWKNVYERTEKKNLWGSFSVFAILKQDCFKQDIPWEDRHNIFQSLLVVVF